MYNRSLILVFCRTSLILQAMQCIEIFLFRADDGFQSILYLDSYIDANIESVVDYACPCRRDAFCSVGIREHRVLSRLVFSIVFGLVMALTPWTTPNRYYLLARLFALSICSCGAIDYPSSLSAFKLNCIITCFQMSLYYAVLEIIQIKQTFRAQRTSDFH